MLVSQQMYDALLHDKQFSKMIDRVKVQPKRDEHHEVPIYANPVRVLRDIFEKLDFTPSEEGSVHMDALEKYCDELVYFRKDIN